MAAHAATWSGWSQLKDWQFTGTPSVVSITPDRAEVFVKNSGGEVLHIWHQPDRSWSDWASLGRVPGSCIAGDPIAKIIPDTGSLVAVFVTSCDLNVYWNYMRSDRSWSGFQSLGGGTIYGPGVAILPNGAFELFIRDSSGRLAHKWQVSKQGPWSSSSFDYWSDVLIEGAPAVEMLNNGDVVVAAVAPNSKVVVAVRHNSNGYWTIRTVDNVAWSLREMSIAKIPKTNGVASIYYRDTSNGYGTVGQITVWEMENFRYNKKIWSSSVESNRIYGTPIVAYTFTTYLNSNGGRYGIPTGEHVLFARGFPGSDLRNCLPSGTSCSVIDGMGFSPSNPAVGYVMGSANALELFVGGTNSKLLHGWWY